MTTDLSPPPAELEDRFPGVLVWFGTHTNRWWAYLPERDAGGARLVEGNHPTHLADQITRTLSRAR